MRETRWILALAALAALGACNRPASTATTVTAPISPPAAPPKTPGLWIERVSAGGAAQVTRLCLDAASAQQLSALGAKLAGQCRGPGMAPSDAGGWRFSTQCDMGAWGKVATDGVARGDFTRHYEVDALSETSGAAQATVNGPRHFKADIRWQGVCPKDMKAGDVVWPDGRRARLADLGAAS